MFSYNDFFALKEEKLKLERENLRLKNEILQLTEIKEQILPMKTYLIEKYQEQVQEKDAKLTSMGSSSVISYQMLNKNEKNNQLIQQNQKLKEEIFVLKNQIKQKEDEFSQKIQQDATEISNLKTILLKYSQQKSQKHQIDTNEINEINDQLKSTVQILSRKYKTLKIESKIKITELIQQNKEKEEEIHLLKEKINRIKRKFQSSLEDEMNNQYKKLFIQSQNLLDLKEAKIQSLHEEISKLKSMQIQHNLNENNEINNQLINQDFVKLENETQNKSFVEIKSNSIQIKNESKQNIIDSNYKRKENEEKITSNIEIQSNKNEMNFDKKGKKMKIKSIHNQSNNEKIQPDHANKSNDNKIQKTNVNNTITNKNNDIENKEKLINKLEVIINMNQGKINRMETEIINLNKQLDVYQKNNEQICEFIQSYKKQNLELIKIAFDNIQKSNHSLKNEICSILLDLSEKIEDNESKSTFINELLAGLNKKDNLTDNSQNNDSSKS